MPIQAFIPDYDTNDAPVAARSGGSRPGDLGSPERIDGPSVSVLGGKYHDAQNGRTISGRSMAAYGRGSGMRSVVIPQGSVMTGVPAGVRPHDVKDMIVNIDPGKPYATKYRIGDMSAHLSREAAAAVAAAVPNDGTIEGERLAGSARMLTITQALKDGYHEDPEPTHTKAAQSRPMPAAPVRAPMPAQASRPASAPRNAQGPANSMLKAFGGQRQQPQPLQGQSPPHPQQHQAPPAPHIHVKFEIEGFGVLESNYHDVIVTPGWLALVWDTRFKAGTKYLPPCGENPPRLALQLDNGKGYLVEPTGIVIPFEEREICLLLIAQSSDLAEEI